MNWLCGQTSSIEEAMRIFLSILFVLFSRELLLAAFGHTAVVSFELDNKIYYSKIEFFGELDYLNHRILSDTDICDLDEAIYQFLQYNDSLVVYNELKLIDVSSKLKSLIDQREFVLELLSLEEVLPSRQVINNVLNARIKGEISYNFYVLPDNSMLQTSSFHESDYRLKLLPAIAYEKEILISFGPVSAVDIHVSKLNQLRQNATYQQFLDYLNDNNLCLMIYWSD